MTHKQTKEEEADAAITRMHAECAQDETSTLTVLHPSIIVHGLDNERVDEKVYD